MLKPLKRDAVISYLQITLGSLVTALGIVLFLTPSQIAAGGVSGIAVIIFHLTKLNPGYTMLLLSLPIFLLGIRIFGTQYGLRSLYGTIALSVGVTVFSYLLGYEGVLAYNDKTDMLLSALFGGVISGAGLGIVMKGGSNTGGTDILAQILHHYSNLPLGSSLIVVDGLVILAAALVFSIEAALFAIITVFATGQVINLVTSGANYAKMALIISSHHQEIREKLLFEMGIGGTVIASQGMFTSESKNMIMSVVRNRKINQIKSIVREIDPDAFIIVTNASEVLGEGFIPIARSGTGIS